MCMHYVHNDMTGQNKQTNRDRGDDEIQKEPNSDSFTAIHSKFEIECERESARESASEKERVE